jgi:hypothetical protein
VTSDGSVFPRLAWRLPQALQPAPARSVRVMAFDDTGRTTDRSG